MLNRLKAVQREALDAGTLQLGRKILYWHYVKGEEEEATLTWRAVDQVLAHAACV